MKICRGPMALLFAAILAMVATDVMAQPGGGRPGGGRGPGGFGGRGPGGPGGFGGRGGGGLLGLIRVKEVREEIELLPDQEEAIQKIGEDRPEIERPEGIDFRDRSEENRAKLEEFMEKVRKQREEFDTKVREQLEEVLFPEQLERLEQIEVQTMGIRALMEERVAKALKITDSQKEELQKKMESGREEMMASMREMFQSGNREGIREKMQAATKEMEEKILGVLTTEQKKDFDEMKGKPFEMPQPEFGGGRGGRGGFGGRGGRGGPGGPGGGGRSRGQE